MLILGRALGQRIIIKVAGVEMVIEVVGTRPKSTRLGFIAPPEAVIIREEVLARQEPADLGGEG